jgi:hypothetical protein
MPYQINENIVNITSKHRHNLSNEIDKFVIEQKPEWMGINHQENIPDTPIYSRANWLIRYEFKENKQKRAKRLVIGAEKKATIEAEKIALANEKLEAKKKNILRLKIAKIQAEKKRLEKRLKKTK